VGLKSKDILVRGSSEQALFDSQVKWGDDRYSHAGQASEPSIGDEIVRKRGGSVGTGGRSALFRFSGGHRKIDGETRPKVQPCPRSRLKKGPSSDVLKGKRGAVT